MCDHEVSCTSNTTKKNLVITPLLKLNIAEHENHIQARPQEKTLTRM